MSDLTPCNYCTLQRLKWRGKVVIKPDPKPQFPTAVNVYILTHAESEPVWIAWFAALSERCTC